MNRHLRFFLLLMSPVFLFSCTRESDLAKDGVSSFKIVVSEQAPEPEKLAAAKLQEYLYRISDVTLPIVDTFTTGENLIFVGFRQAPESLIHDLNPEDFENEQYILRSDGHSLLIAGGGTRGTLYGVIGYLSDHLGCRWYTREVVKVPKQATLRLTAFEDRQRPAFEYREAWYHEAYDREWALHNRLNPSIRPLPDSMGGSYITYPFAHTFANLVPPARYFADHPEYFSEINGKRQADHAQLCLTNPEVVRIATEQVFQWIHDHPDANIFSIDQNDGEGNCECSHCQAIDAREGSPSGSLLHFVNQIADTVGKVYPGLQLQTFAYAYTEAPPATIRPADNVTIRLCHYNYCSAHAMDGCDHHQPFRERFDQWNRIAGRISVWDYFTDFSQYLMPYPNFEPVTQNLKWYADRGVKGIFAQGNKVPDNGGGEFSELRAWVFSQLLWDPYRDGYQLIAEFLENVYSPSAPYIQAYIDMLQEQVVKDSLHFSIWAQPLEVNYLGVRSLRKADSLFVLARQAATGDTALSGRVELAYLPVLYSKLYFYSVGGSAYLSKAEYPQAMEQFRHSVARHRITAIGDVPQTYGNLEAFIRKVENAPHFLTDWWLAGPFDNTHEKGLFTAYAPEKVMQLTDEYEGINQMKVNWQPYHDNLSGYIDLTRIFSPSEYVVAYAYHNYKCEAPKTVTFGVGSNDGVRVWINEKLVLDRPVSRKAEPNQDKITVGLQQGDNHILVKVDQLARAWGFYFTEL